MVDDSHAVGFVGKTGRGTHEYNEVMGKIDIITGTLGKGPRWGHGWLYQRQKRNYRYDAPAFTPLFVFQFPFSCNYRGKHCSA